MATKQYISQLLCWLLLAMPVSAQDTSGSLFDTTYTSSAYDDYVHQGITDKTFKEACEELEKQGGASKGSCGNNAYNSHGSRLMVAAMAYGLIMGYSAMSPQALNLVGMSSAGRVKDAKSAEDILRNQDVTGGKPTDPNAADEVSQTQHAKKQEKGASVEQVCDFALGAATGIIMVTQQMGHSQVQQTYQSLPVESRQKQALYSVSEIHNSKKKGYITQSAIFGVAAACYSYAAFLQAGRPIVVAKAAGSALLSGFFADTASKHNGIKNKALEFADAMPGRGECAPGTPCFCVEETSAESDPVLYQKYCIDQQLHRDFATDHPSACIDAQGKSDPTCSCMKQNSCFDTFFFKAFKGDVLTGKFKKDLYGSIKKVYGGNPSTDELSSIAQSSVQNSQAVLNHLDSKLFSNSKLTEDQRRIADQLKKSGLPSNISKLLAKAKINNKYSRNFKKNNAIKSGQYLLAKTTQKLTGRKIKGSSSGADFASMLSGLNKLKTPSKPRGGIEYTTDQYSRQVAAQNRAVAMAQINLDDSRPIFDIISSRYQKSTWESD